jgi:hypothetical protein
MILPSALVHLHVHRGFIGLDVGAADLAVEQDAHNWADVKTIDDLGKEFERELEDFFVNYYELSGKQYRVLGVEGPNQARKVRPGCDERTRWIRVSQWPSTLALVQKS